jgi:hypothetical protein
MDRNAEGDASDWEQPWPCGETLRTLAELNEQCLELLVEQATTQALGAPPMFRDLLDLWTGLDAASRRRAAACPFLLLDAGYAWYMARTEPLGSALYLGMPAHCAGWLRTCTVRQVTELANLHAGWLRPRWPGRVRIWRELLVAAISGEGPALEMARLHGVQLLAMELKALDQVSAKEPRQNVR